MLTAGIRAWLEKLAAEGIAHRPRNNIGYRAMHLGLTQWVMSDGNETLTWEAFNARFEPGEERGRAWDTWDTIGETLTAAGRLALAEPSRRRAP